VLRFRCSESQFNMV